MNVYLVGGAVRDEILGYPFSEKDWVVTGSTPQEMVRLGYRPVGKDFPVFLHPETQEEYALARTERKTGVGYHGFTFNCDPSIKLKDDLSRRDLTVNAIAKSPEGVIIDPYGGVEDIQNKCLRHISEAFAEDPLRVLRTARFLARYQHLGFNIAKTTLALMTQLSQSKELQALSKERIWIETHKALTEPNPSAYFKTLMMTGADRAAIGSAIRDINWNTLDRIAEPDLRWAYLVASNNHALNRFKGVPNTYRKTAEQASFLFTQIAEGFLMLLRSWLFCKLSMPLNHPKT